MAIGELGTRDGVLARVVRATWVTCALAWACFLVLFSPPVSAQTGRPGSSSFDTALVAKLTQRGDLTLRDATLSQALFTIGETWKINLVIGDEVQGKVNGAFQDAPLHEILDSILLANGYSYRPVGQGLVVMKTASLGEANHPLFETTTLVLRHGEPEAILPALRILSSPQGKIHAIPTAKSFVVVDFPERVATIRRMIDQIDQAVGHATTGTSAGGEAIQVAAYSPQFILAKSLKDPLEDVLSKEGRVSILENENQVLVVDVPASLKLASDLVKKLDVPRPQVRITALIYDISLEDVEALGINWKSSLKGRHNGSGDPQSAFSIDSVTRVPLGMNQVDSLMTFMNLSRNLDLTAVVSALQTAKDARLLADPSIVVRNNEKAMIQIIQEIPFQQLTQTSGGGNIGTTGFREAGVKLEVQPRIANDGTVLLEVAPSFSRLSGEQNGQPVIDRRETKTSVRVVSGQTLVIGGLKTRSDVGEFNGVPYLKDLRFGLGKLFRGKETRVTETELVVFITPEIIGCDACESPRHGYTYEGTRELLDRIPMIRLPAVRGTTPPRCPPIDPQADSPAEIAPPHSPISPPSTTTGAPNGMTSGSQRITYPLRKKVPAPSATDRAPPPARETENSEEPVPSDPRNSLRLVPPSTTLSRLPPVMDRRWPPPARYVARQPTRAWIDSQHRPATPEKAPAATAAANPYGAIRVSPDANPSGTPRSNPAMVRREGAQRY